MAESVETKSVDIVAESENKAVHTDADSGKTTTSDAVNDESKSIDTVALAKQHLAAGKRDLLTSDPNAAVASMALACELLGKYYGETAFECGEAYYFYGKALLELVRLETEVLDNIDGADNESVDDGGAENSKSESNGENKEQGEANKTVENEASEGEKDEAGDEGHDEKDEANEGVEYEAKEGAEDQAKEVDKDEDVSNIQLAWEMLELARNILVKQAESIKVVNAADDQDAEEKTKLKNEVENRLSDTFQTLGELSIENENYPQAIEDLEACLKRRQEMMEKDSRCIAETHYQLGVAQGFNMEFDEAVKSLEGSIHVLQIRIEKLKSKTESIDSSKGKENFLSRDEEIKEIEALIPEIREKIADTKDMKAETFKKIGDKKSMEEGIAANLGLASGDAENGNTSTSKAVSTISSNLIKKRPATDADSTESKKVHIESTVSASGENISAGKGI